MDVKIVVLILGLLTLLEMPVDADFFYNPMPPTAEEVKKRNLKCIPGRTVIKIGKEPEEQDEDSEETRRSHMNTETKDETCKICVCSTEGKDEYCSRRPARNINECIKLSMLKKSIEKNMPFAHERALSFRIRRDYIWHYDEIPYEARASCKRSTSYYSNSVTANNTDIDVASDIDSLLDYSNKDICFYCVCSVDGKQAGCISRDPWYCEYYRIIRSPGAVRNRFRQLFQQDRPAYFRQLSYRLRRTMDEGIVTYYNAVGADSANNTKCVPFVSEYSDCTEANYCSGCSRCRCNEDGDWRCEKVFECPIDEDDESSDRNTIISALDVMVNELKNKEKRKARPLVPPPPRPEDQLIVPENNPYEEDFETYLSRQKRSAKEDFGNGGNKNLTIKFFHTVDEINEDTLKKSNKSGTIEAKKMQANRIPKISRRTGLLDNFNKTAFSSLHIKYNQPQDYERHIAENKIDASNLRNKLDESELQKVLGNYSQNIRDRDLSKLVVNELKPGAEIIGDKNVSPTSNITFTPENDTLTAMAFIAGNLLSKLWDMEKDGSDDSIETEVLKHQKINDLLDLFKEPLSIRQETFLKNALEKLSNTLNKNKSMKNVSICETISEADHIYSSDERDDKDDVKVEVNKTKCNQSELLKEKEYQYNVSLGVVSKLNNVLGLIKKFENVQKHLQDIKNQTSSEQFNIHDTISENSSLEHFGSLLDKITKLLIPNTSKSQGVRNKITKMNQFRHKNVVNKVLKTKPKSFLLDKIHITAKDRIILDYLNHIENNPNCLFKNKIHKKAENLDVNIEGNILYNLSEFLKIKSFVNLMQLTQPEYSSESLSKSTTEIPKEIPSSTLKQNLRNGTMDEIIQLNTTKEKLKLHLKAIIDDLLQLQKEHGLNNDKQVNIIEALPCIYNILNADILKEQKIQRPNITQVANINKMKTLIEMMKSELANNLPTRRNNLISTERSKSAITWERMIKNINNFQKNTRRSFNLEKPKTYEELKKIMDQVGLVGSSYKNFALFSATPPYKRLMLLKTLEADTKQQYNALTNIHNSMDILNKISLDEYNDIKEFIENTDNNLRLSTKVLENLDRLKQNRNKKSEAEVLFPKISKILKKQPINLFKSFDLSKEKVEHKDDKIKLSRDQILVQLMINRVQFYLKSKEAKESEFNDDINYNIGKRILFLIQSGNLNVAKELFSIFMANKNKHENLSRLRDSTTTANYPRKRAPLFLALKEPLITFDGPGQQTEVQIKDNLKQLLNL